MDTAYEKELVKRAIKGDVVAFEELIVAHQKRVYNIALNFSKNHDDAIELAQEAFLKAFKSITNFVGNSSFSTWLFRITTNTCIDTYRKEQNINMVYIDEDISTDDEKSYTIELKSRLPDPSSSYLQKELRENLLQILGKLPLELKSIVLLRDVHGFNYEEISQILEIPLGTVKSRINRARQTLRQIIGTNCELFENKFV